jgi:hypothetical protein
MRSPLEPSDSSALEVQKPATQQTLECKIGLAAQGRSYAKQTEKVLGEAITGMNAMYRKSVEAVTDVSRTKAILTYKGKPAFLLVDTPEWPYNGGMRLGEKGRSFGKGDLYEFVVGTLETPTFDFSEKFLVHLRLKPVVDLTKCGTTVQPYGDGRASRTDCNEVMQNVFEQGFAQTRRTKLAPLFGGGIDDRTVLTVRCIYQAGATAAERAYYATPLADDIDAPASTPPAAYP